MQAHAAGTGIQHRHVERIQQLMAEIAARGHIVGHLLSITFRAGYYFLALACITAGAVGLADGRTYLAQTWGVAGLVLLLLWVGAKVSEWGGTKVLSRLRDEISRDISEIESEIEGHH